jgi:hypothetical protein
MEEANRTANSALRDFAEQLRSHELASRRRLDRRNSTIGETRRTDNSALQDFAEQLRSHELVHRRRLDWMDSTIAEPHRTGSSAALDWYLQLWNHEHANQRHDPTLFQTLIAATDRVTHHPLNFSPIITVVDAAPDEEAQLEAVMVRLAKKGDYDPLTAELAIATIGPHDTDALIDYLENLAIAKIEQTTTASGKKVGTCAACEEQSPVRDLILASCGHCYCRSCVGIMFDAATKDESCYPPKCCKNAPIPVDHAKRLLDPELEARFQNKAVEFETINRTYCSNPGCSMFMPPSEIDSDAVTCPSCSERTCVTCKAPAHRGECPADLELASLLELAQEMRWQRCYNCLRIVQKDNGCEHME